MGELSTTYSPHPSRFVHGKTTLFSVFCLQGIVPPLFFILWGPFCKLWDECGLVFLCTYKVEGRVMRGPLRNASKKLSWYLLTFYVVESSPMGGTSSLYSVKKRVYLLTLYVVESSPMGGSSRVYSVKKSSICFAHLVWQISANN